MKQVVFSGGYIQYNKNDKIKLEYGDGFIILNSAGNTTTTDIGGFSNNTRV